MNNLLLICGLALLSGAPAQQNVEENEDFNEASVVLNDDCESDSDFDLNEIIYIEHEPEIDLGFDTADYLPENFDPYKLYVDFDAIEYVVDDNEIVLGFNTKDYLPMDFNPYADPSGIDGINYIEEETELDLGFDTAEYLPEDFDPYFRVKEPKAMATL